MQLCNIRGRLLQVLVMGMVAVVIGVEAHAQSNLVVNGSFETPISTNTWGWPPSTWWEGQTFDGWTVEFGSVDLHRGYTIWGYPYDGEQALDLTGSPGRGAVHQDITLTEGGVYRLQFALNGNYEVYRDYRSALVQLLAGTDVVFSKEYTHTFDPTYSLDRQSWLVFTEQLTLTAGTYRLRFESQETRQQGWGPTIDDVRLQLVPQSPVIPEPTTLVLMGSALPSLMLACRRRKR